MRNLLKTVAMAVVLSALGPSILVLTGCKYGSARNNLTEEKAERYFAALKVGACVSDIEEALHLPKPRKVLAFWDEDFVRYEYDLSDFYLFFKAIPKGDSFYYVGVYEVVSYEEMRETWEVLSKYSADEFRCAIELGRLSEKYGKLAEAFRSYERARRIKPNHYLPYRLLGLLELKRKNTDMALDYLEEAVDLLEKSAEQDIDRSVTQE